MKPTKEFIYALYIEQQVSPENIGKQCGYSGRRIRELMTEYGIPRLGPSHLRKNKTATWNVGVKRSAESKEKNRQAHLGKIPYNKGEGTVSFKCEVCDKEVFDKPYRRKRVCSKECRDVFNRLSRGEEHWNYKGDSAGFVQRKRNWSQYKEWRTAVLNRANFTCAACHQRGGRLTAHHLYTWNNYPEKRFDPENGACLCWKCHWSFHNDCSHHHTTEDMFKEWLTKWK